MLSIWREFLSNHRQRVVVDGGSQSFLACHRDVCWVLFISSFILVKYLSWWRTDYMPMRMTPHTGSRSQASRQTCCCCLPINRDLARIQKSCTHWSMILNNNKTKALMVSRSRTVNPPNDDLVLSGISICASPNSTFLVRSNNLNKRNMHYYFSLHGYMLYNKCYNPT